ncbi:MAG TPA: succinylglutamate desuccinylase/aspartoacylase family protein [Alphaproteobacteria bacterium]|nr:succinylglutamate desuccinylase/aspartoacylase family protein [Alphaproteobacteria bacterium]
MIRSVTYAGLEPGPRFFVLGAIHGNEKCGTIGCERVMKEIDSGELKIKKGKVTFVPIGNPRAYDQDKRFTERNLNRYLVPHEKPDTYEAKLGNILCPMLENCDVHLSIHSYTVGGEPFIFVSQHSAKEHEFAAALGPYTQLTGWDEAYAATGRKKKAEDDEEGTGSIEYARRFGALAVNIECGQHKDPKAPDVAYHAIRNALRYLGMTDEAPLKPDVSKSRLVTVTHVFYRDDEGDLAKHWKHLEPVKKAEPIAFHADKSPIASPENGFVIMPREGCPVGEEWFYVGVEKAA